MRATVDSNILIYSVDPNDRIKQSVAIDIVRRLALGGSPLAEQCVFEFLHATTRKLRVPLTLAVGSVAAWTATFAITLATPNTLGTTLQLLGQYKLSVWDARLLAICHGDGIEVLLTEDLQDGGKYGTVTVLNPFNAANAGSINALLPP